MKDLTLVLFFIMILGFAAYYHNSRKPIIDLNSIDEEDGIVKYKMSYKGTHRDSEISYGEFHESSGDGGITLRAATNKKTGSLLFMILENGQLVKEREVLFQTLSMQNAF